MEIQPLYQILEPLIRLVAMTTAIALIWRRQTRPGPVVLVALNAGLILVVNLVFLFPAMGIDYEFFRKAGLDALRGLDPYSPSRFALHPFLNPPTALPLFAGFAKVQPRIGLAAWTLANLGALAALPWLVERMLDRFRGETSTLPWPSWLGLTVALVVSDASLVGIYIGQLSILTTLAIVVALDARGRGRAILAGLALAVASVKVSTMIPFLLIFSKRSDLKTWMALVVFGLAMGLAFGGPAELPGRLKELANHVEEMARPGMTNDYSFEGTEHANMIGFDHLVYRLGLRDRGSIRIVQASLVVAMGGWVAWLVLGRRVEDGVACSLVSLFSMVFLYHRNYDLVILAIPLVQVARYLPMATGYRRSLMAVSGTAMLLALYLNVNLMVALSRSSVDWEPWPRRLAQGILLPQVTWLLLLATFTMVLGTRRSRPDPITSSR